jgi:hypothetical protein
VTPIKRFFDVGDVSSFYESLKKHVEQTAIEMPMKTVAHYFSDPAVLDSILSTGKLRASNIYFLNDWQEHTRGIDFLTQVFCDFSGIKEVLTRIKTQTVRESAGIYSISFASDADNLQHWVTYGNKSGVCIELDYKFMCDKTNFWQQFEDDTYDPNTQCPLAHIAYTDSDLNSSNSLLKPDKVRDYFIEAAKEATGNYALDLQMIDESCMSDGRLRAYLTFLATYYKTKQFEGEKEIRASFFPRVGIKQRKNKILYHRMNSGVLRPYIEILFGKRYVRKQIAAIPITRITVGPSEAQNRLFESIVHRVNYGDTSAVYSDENFVISQYKKYVEEAHMSFDNNIRITKNLLHKSNLVMGHKFDISSAGSALKYIKPISRTVPKINSDYEKKIDFFLTQNYLSDKGIWVRKSNIPYIF